MVAQCPQCKKVLKYAKNLKRHVENCHRTRLKSVRQSVPNSISCPHCPQKFKKKRYLETHCQRFHNSSRPRYWCLLCSSISVGREAHLQHLESHKPEGGGFHLYRSALNNKCLIYRKFFGGDEVRDVQTSFQVIGVEMIEIIKYHFAKNRHLKCFTTLIAEFIQLDSEGQATDSLDVPIRSASEIIRSLDEIKPFVRNAELDLITRVEDFVNLKSCWILNNIIGRKNLFYVC